MTGRNIREAVVVSSVGAPDERRHLSFTAAEWTRLAGVYGFVTLLHILGWGLYLHYANSRPALVGLGLAAYMFGLRHAFDADHIAAVDDTVRFLLQKGKRPLGVGFFFSLGHSTIVFALALAIGTIELLQVSRTMLDLRGPFFDFIGDLDFGALGYVIVGVFLMAWGTSFALWRFMNIEERHPAGALRTCTSITTRAAPVTRTNTCTRSVRPWLHWRAPRAACPGATGLKGVGV
jgi:high-affinity nickel permease